MTPCKRTGRGEGGLHGRGSGGFSLIEILVALVIVGILTALLGQVMQSVMQGSAELRQRFRNSDQLVVIRRLLHRDLQAMSSLNGLAAAEDSLTFSSSHAQLQDAPLPVEVTWAVEGERLVRIERIADLDYFSRMEVARDVIGLFVQVYGGASGEWYDYDDRPDLLTTGTPAIRVMVTMRKATPVIILERFPLFLTRKQ